MSAQQQVRKMLEKDFGFEYVSAKETAFGKRLLMRCKDAGIEAQIGAYRTGFYAVVNTETKENLPSVVKPLCFDTDHKANIRAFLEKTLNVSKKNTRQKILFVKA